MKTTGTKKGLPVTVEAEFMHHDHFDCLCDHAAHAVRFSYILPEHRNTKDDPEDDDMYLEVQFAPGTLWERIKRSYHHLFARDYPMWGSFILKRKDAERLITMAQTYIDTCGVVPQGEEDK